MGNVVEGFENLSPYFGDIHSHCDISYGHGSLEDAFRNAQLQLDFASVTAHAHWPDLPANDRRLSAVNLYHREGFQHALAEWPRYRDLTNAVNADGDLVTFLSFEWHSLLSGDHNVYYRGDDGEIIPATDLGDMRANLRRLLRSGVSTMLIPHHIGYLCGYRGINWSEFTTEFSPFVEIFSMHGASESDTAPYPYLHTMGPRDGRSTMQHGLAEGHVFGVVGSTDSHSAHPGSYGHGRMGAWATELTRDGIWEAFQARRTVALTGDNIQLAFAVNRRPMGSLLPYTDSREIGVSVVGGDAIDYVEIVHNNRVVMRWDGAMLEDPNGAYLVKVHLELGWGELDEMVNWDIDLEVRDGRLLDVETRFRGADIGPSPVSENSQFTFSDIRPVVANRVRFTTRSWRNPTIVSPATQGVSMDIRGSENTRLVGQINGRPVDMPLTELFEGTRAGHLGGFLSPAYAFHRAATSSECTLSRSFTHVGAEGRGWYYVRVRQKNNQWAWSSPIWIDAPKDAC